MQQEFIQRTLPYFFPFLFFVFNFSLCIYSLGVLRGRDSVYGGRVLSASRNASVVYFSVFFSGVHCPLFAFCPHLGRLFFWAFYMGVFCCFLFFCGFGVAPCLQLPVPRSHFVFLFFIRGRRRVHFLSSGDTIR